ncbi:MAG: hypothetical protein LC125_00775 [Burkholderiales bacterium]|nr:hypothetical protein [Burkholderiales bacterium]
MSDPIPRMPEGRPLPSLPPDHPLQARLAAWCELRDQLVELNARLEYLRLMMRLEQRRD